MQRYQCTHTVEAAQWIDTDENRELFYDWFHIHDAIFETRGPVVCLPEGGEVNEGEWIFCSDGEFLALDDESFRDQYSLAGCDK